jgi:cation transport ATPase
VIRRPPFLPVDQPNPSLDALLDRPADQRLREYKYRFAQAAVFGLPVLALQWLGTSLSGEDAPRWVGIFQAILTGWIVYVAGAGMLFEGIVRIRRKVTGDFLVSAAAVALYVLSVASLVRLLFARRYWFQPLLFHAVVMMLGAWCALRWAILARRSVKPLG